MAPCQSDVHLKDRCNKHDQDQSLQCGEAPVSFLNYSLTSEAIKAQSTSPLHAWPTLKKRLVYRFTFLEAQTRKK